MIYTPLTKKAMKIAYDAHHGQTDKSGTPYIFHPMHLAEQMTTEAETCIALLHDVVEDTEVTLEDLAEDFPQQVIEALKLLTRADGTDYFDYIRKIRYNPLAKAVKLADLAHNSDETRLAGAEGVTEADILRWRTKYARAKEILQSE